MPSIDYAELKKQIRFEDLLRGISYRWGLRIGDFLRGPCPLHHSSSHRSRSFWVNIKTQRYGCFKCGVKGDVLDFYCKLRHCDVYRAALDLCQHLGIQPPPLKRK